jgi:PST family polysaccharide transporter
MSEVKPEVFATIKNLFATKTRRKLFENFLSLSFLQFANYIFPLITLPYLVRVLGPEKYGLIAFAQAFIGYFQILTDYGFNLSATREISINRENKEKVSEIFSSVMIIKFFLLLFSLGLMTIIVFSFKKFRQDWLIYYLTFGMVLGQTLFPIWFFQGMGRMKYITFLNVLAKLIFTIAIFIFVKRSSDYLYIPLLNSSGFIVAGILALFLHVSNYLLQKNFLKGGI